MQITVKDYKVTLIGDPHFGKRFGNVPLHRKGDREEMQMKKFVELLNDDADICIMVGDLFDIPVVSNEVLMKVYYAILWAMNDNRKKDFIFIAGNHDMSRDREVVTSFEVLTELLSAREGNEIWISRNEPIHYESEKGDINILAIPYNEYKKADQVVSEFLETYPCKNFDMVVGHWDTMSVVGDEHNMIPLPLLVQATNLIITGHVHTKESFYLDAIGSKTDTVTGRQVLVTGSLQPYGFDQDPDEELYVSRTVEQIEAALQQDPNSFRDKAVRVLLFEGEEMPADFDCLQLQKHTIKKDDEENLTEVKMEVFSFKELYTTVMTENEVPQESQDYYWEQYQQRASDVFNS